MIKYMLDTNIVAYVINNAVPSLKDKLAEHEGNLCISAVTLAELAYGIEKSTRKAYNAANVENFCALVDVPAFDANAAGHLGQIRYELEKAGTPVGAYDAMIAAHARSLGLVLVTNNEKEFARVAGLRVENWA